jgi:hypothetical protein
MLAPGGRLVRRPHPHAKNLSDHIQWLSAVFKCGYELIATRRAAPERAPYAKQVGPLGKRLVNVYSHCRSGNPPPAPKSGSEIRRSICSANGAPSGRHWCLCHYARFVAPRAQTAQKMEPELCPSHRWACPGCACGPGFFVAPPGVLGAATALMSTVVYPALI